ncbi:unnamed protein product [Absidia cylindrospora]
MARVITLRSGAGYKSRSRTSMMVALMSRSPWASFMLLVTRLLVSWSNSPRYMDGFGLTDGECMVLF